MDKQAAFPGLPDATDRSGPADEGSPSRGKVRVLRPVRNQAQLLALTLDDLLPPDHRARAVWEFVDGLDLGELYGSIQAVEGRAGRPAIDPKTLLALWLYGLGDGVRSARELDELCREHLAYRWLCGGVTVNYHTLSDFRQQDSRFDELLTQMLAVLLHEGLLEVEQVAQDGMRIRASAGASSFHTKSSLDKHLATAQVRVRQSRAPSPTPGRTARQQAAQERAARERAERIRKAQEKMPEAEQAMKARAERKRTGEPRTSTTDDQARVMKMSDGGFRPAYNGQFATDVKTTLIVGVEVSTVGSDMAQLPPMLDQLERRLGCLPRDVLVDGGYPSAKTLADADARGVTVYAPVPHPRAGQTHTRDRYAPAKGDTKVKAKWRQRMATAEAQETYRKRAATAELVNARLRRNGLIALTVRGCRKVRAMLLLSALAHNVSRLPSLRKAEAVAT